MEENSPSEWLKTAFAEAGYPLTALQAQQFCSYLMELERWNRKMNLTAFRSREAVLHKLFLASLDFVQGFQPVPGLQLLDLGSGAGIPGIPLKIMFPYLVLTLLERSHKKGIFLQHICRLLGLQDIQCVMRDASDLARESGYQERYDLVVSRAVGSLQLLVHLAFPLLRPGGKLLTEKGAGYRAEIQEVEHTLAEQGGRVGEILSLPSSSGLERWLVCLHKEVVKGGK